MLETIELSAETQQRLLAIAGAGTEVRARRRLYIEIVRNGIPFLAWPPSWHLLARCGSLKHFELAFSTSSTSSSASSNGSTTTT
ncbi:MAG: hypothetical protein H6708_17380 [Kofleriaceae bacterium]|nr:hypothetical protein [Myxococcales bacterium]MCB9562179.1 hypothetical protein [Kofleriaceae bacterium]